MNSSIIKMLRFEWKSNLTMWIYSLIIGFSAISIFLYKMSTSSNPSGLRDLYFFIYIIITWLFTLQSYQESTNSQSMQMYHLIGVSRNIKFLSKQIITLLGLPLILIGGTYLFVCTINLFNLGNGSLDLMPRSGKVIIWFVIWILGHSISTLLAIIFKKNKVLYVMLTFFIMQTVFGIGIMILLYLFKSIGFMDSSNFSGENPLWEIISLTGAITLAVIFYGISYHLFFKRQL